MDVTPDSNTGSRFTSGHPPYLRHREGIARNYTSPQLLFTIRAATFYMTKRHNVHIPSTYVPQVTVRTKTHFRYPFTNWQTILLGAESFRALLGRDLTLATHYYVHCYNRSAKTSFINCDKNSESNPALMFGFSESAPIM